MLLVLMTDLLALFDLASISVSRLSDSSVEACCNHKSHQGTRRAAMSHNSNNHRGAFDIDISCRSHRL